MTSVPRFTFQPRHDMTATALGFAQIRPYGGASLIVADPPWRHNDWGAGDKRKTPGHHYKTQPMGWIEDLPVEVLAAKNCLLWLWATAPLLPAALQVADAWGFEFKTAGVWVKRSAHGKLAMAMGRRLRSCHEPFILATKGQPRVAGAIRSALIGHETAEDEGITLVDPFASIGVTIEAVRREHSRKPDLAFEAARQCVEGPAIEVFGRQQREGWIVWGDQSDKFSEAAE